MCKQNGMTLFEKLRAGEEVLCEKCKTGHYDNKFKSADKMWEFHCDTCDNFIRVEPNIVVE